MNVIDELKLSVEAKSRQADRLIKVGQTQSAAKLFKECSFFMSKLAQLEPLHSGTWTSKSTFYKELAERSYDKAETAVTGHPRVSIAEDGALTHGPPPSQSISPTISFSDISGLETVKQRIKESVIWPSSIPEAYEHYDLRPGSNILLYGPPGCGKTLISKAAAFESKAVFIEITPSEIRDKYVGESEKRLRDYFQHARSHEKSVILIDELDGIGGTRSGNASRHDISVISELLLQLQNLKDHDGSAMVIGASNRPWEIDSALRRPGRFDTMLFIPHPDLATRHHLLIQHNANRPLSASVCLELIAQRLDGYSCSEIIEVCDEAARVALREYGTYGPPRPINDSDFQLALAHVKSGTLAWYKQSIAQVSIATDRDLFGDMIASGESLSMQLTLG